MNKKILFGLILLLLCVFFGCSNDEEQVLKLKFITNSEEVISDLKVKYEEISAVKLSSLTSETKDFNGWFIDEDLKTEFTINYLKSHFEDKEIVLYAKWTEKKENKEMKDIQLTFIGLIDDKIAVNSLYKWDNPNNDTSFNVCLYDDFGNQIFINDVTKTELQLDFVLEYGTNYKMVITGKESNKTNEFHFQTIGSKSDKYLNVVNAELTVLEPFKDHMVIQRNKLSYLRGKTVANLVVKAKLNGEVFYTVSNNTGDYAIPVNPTNVVTTGSELIISISENRKCYIHDVLVGDVYLVSGQSNIQWCLKDSDYLPEDVQKAIDNNVRYFSQDTQTCKEKSDKTLNGKWFMPSKFDTGYTYFSAIAFMVGSMLSEEVTKDIPIGIICASQGDTNIVNWLSTDYYDGSIATKNEHYNGMIYPLRNTNLSGVIWYQGCNNSSKGIEYKDLLLKLFANYRELFQNNDLPFYVVQLPVYDGDSGNNFDFSYVRESQLKACESDDKAYLIATCDGGDPTYIHPHEKRYICERLTKSILSTVYNKDYLSEGPIYQSFQVENDKAIITVKNSQGLFSKDEIVGFEVAGIDGKYYKAKATIKDEKIEVCSNKVQEIVNIRYGFSKSPFLNIFNKDGYVMSPFRTDKNNLGIDLLNYDDLTVYETHPDGSKMDKEIITINNQIGLKITKNNDGKTYGSIILNKWGAIGYETSMFKLKVIGTNSQSKVLFRIVEGSYEIWAYTFIDDFEGEKEFLVSTSDFICVYNKKDNELDLQGVMSLEITIENNGKAEITILDAKLLELERTSPMSFNIIEASVGSDSIIVSYSKSLFAEKYEVVISKDGKEYTDPLFTSQTSGLKVLYQLQGNEDKNIPYYVKVTAINELGKKDAKNSGYVIYFENDNILIINNFDYQTDESLNAYLEANMKVHEGLKVELAVNGVHITSSGKGWQYFIFVIEKGLNNGFTSLQFTADFSNYKGEVIIELVDQNYQICDLKLDLIKQENGIYEIPLTDFINKTSKEKFDGRDLIWVSFNFSDTIGGVILFDNLQFKK